MNKKIKYIGFKDEFGNPQSYSLNGDNPKVMQIVENSPKHSTDKWYYDIKFLSGDTLRIFNPITVRF